MASPARLTLFHTAQSNVALFDALVREIAPDVAVRHVVDEAILHEARDAGRVTPALAARVDAAMAALQDDGGLVLCTCSTIGGLAERNRPNLLRVDRPMAERAVSLGRRIAIAATLPSTIEPTRALLEDVADAGGIQIVIVSWYLDTAWPFMERGDRDGYATEIARAVGACLAAEPVEVVVLAQASMAGAEPMLAPLPVPVLSSPRLGVEAAVSRALTSAGMSSTATASPYPRTPRRIP